MSTIVVSHRYRSGDRGDWYPHLREEMESLGHAVDIPNLPDTLAPQPEPWRTAFAERASAAPAPEVVLVGHSVGAVNVLRFLQHHDPDRDGVFAGVVLVAAPAHEVGFAALAGFFAEPFDWPAIRRSARRFHALVAADDPVLVPDPFEHVAIHVTELGATGTVLAEGGHLTSDPGDRIELPALVRLVRDVTDEH